MLSNSVIAGGVAAAYLAVLMLQLNPHYPIDLGPVTALGLMLGAAYGINLAVLFYALIVFRQILAAEVLSPGWVSVRLLAWLLTIAAGGGSAVMWLNLRSFGSVLDLETTRRMAAGAIVTTAAATVFLMIGLAHINRRGGRASATILVLTALMSVVMPTVLRGPARERPVLARVVSPFSEATAAPGLGRVVMLMLDGASLDVISPAVAEGRLPNFGRIFDGGSVVHLATVRPTQAETVWSAVATGRVPMQNGVRSSASYRVLGVSPPITLLPDYSFAQALIRFGFLWEEPHTAEDLTARPLWNVLSDQGVPVGVIGWPLTQPASPVRGYLVSDRLHRLTPAELDIDLPSSVWPPSMLETARLGLSTTPDPDPVALVSVLGAAPPAGDYDVASDPMPVVADRVHAALLAAFATIPARFVAVRFPGVDAVGHYFLRYAAPSSFGDVSDEERRRYGRILEQYYGFLDTQVGRVIDTLGPHDVLLVVSAFGMEPVSPGKRLLERMVGNAAVSGTHERAPDGFLLAYGAQVQPGRPPRGSVLDLAPTVLYFFGLPAGRDMEGFARTELFRGAFTAERPVTYIPSYGR